MDTWAHDFWQAFAEAIKPESVRVGFRNRAQYEAEARHSIAQARIHQAAGEFDEAQFWLADAAEWYAEK